MPWNFLRPKAAKARREPPRPEPPSPPPGLFAPAAGWWRDDAAEQVRNFQSWVYAAVNAIAQEAARQTPTFYENTGQAEHEQTPLAHGHPLGRLLARPNPSSTPWDLWYSTVVSLELTGNSYWFVADDPRTGLPAEVWVIPAAWVRVEAEAGKFVTGYTVAAPGSPAVRFGPREVIHLKYPNPSDPYYGLSPLQANALAVDANMELQRSRCHSFRAGSRPGMVLQTEQMLSEPAIRRLEDSVTQRFAGRENWHRPLILEQGLKASPWTLTPAEMDYLNSSRTTRDEILAAYRVPPLMVGLVENAGLGSDIWAGARVMFCEGTVQPKLELLGQVLTRDLGTRFGADIRIEFPDCSPRAEEARRTADERDVKSGVRTLNEVRRSRGLEPYAEAEYDRPFAALGGRS